MEKIITKIDGVSSESSLDGNGDISCHIRADIIRTNAMNREDICIDDSISDVVRDNMAGILMSTTTPSTIVSIVKTLQQHWQYHQKQQKYQWYWNTQWHQYKWQNNSIEMISVVTNLISASTRILINGDSGIRIGSKQCERLISSAALQPTLALEFLRAWQSAMYRWAANECHPHKRNMN